MKNIWHFIVNQSISSLIRSFQDALHVPDDSSSSISQPQSIFPQHVFPSIRNALFKDYISVEATRIAIWSYHDRESLACTIV